MGLRDWLRHFFGQMVAIPGLASAERVAALIPADAEYVTVGPVLVLLDARAFVAGSPGRGPYGRDLGFVPDGDGQRQEISLLVLAGRRLCVISPAGERWSSDVSLITDLDGHRRSGFVVLTRSGGGIAVSTQTPVEVPTGASWHTVSGMTTLFSGWDEVLAKYGVRSHW